MSISAAPAPGPRAEDLSPTRQWLALAVLLLAVLVIAIDNTVLGFAVPELSEALDPSSTQLLWIVDSYGFVLAGLLVTMGSIGDRIGRRRLLMIGAAGFAVASTLAAWSTSPEMLIAARALLGVAGATLMPSTLSLIRNVFLDEAKRRLAIAIWAAGFAIGAALGPIVGGWLLEHAWWGSVFLLALPVMALLLVVGPRLLPESRHPSPGRFDRLSSPLSLAAILPAVYAAKHTAVHGPSLRIAALAAVGVAFGIAFVRRQRRLEEPMLDLRLFAERAFATAIGTNLVANLAMIGTLFLVAQHLQLLGELGPLAAGLHLVPAMVAAGLASLGAAAALQRGISTGRALGLSMALLAVGLATLATVVDGTDPRPVAAAMVVVGLGVGAATSLGSNLVMAVVPAHRAGSASAVSETAFEMGAALGVALLGSIASAVYRRTVDLPAGLDPVLGDRATDTLGGAAAVAVELGPVPADAVLAAARDAFGSGFQAAALVAAVLSAAAAAAAAVSLRGRSVRPAPTGSGGNPSRSTSPGRPASRPS